MSGRVDIMLPPLVALVKQARAHGVGCVLATQNPMDLDYRALSNAGTWMLGRLQTDADRARVIEGLGEDKQRCWFPSRERVGAGQHRQALGASLVCCARREEREADVAESAVCDVVSEGADDGGGDSKGEGGGGVSIRVARTARPLSAWWLALA